MRTVILDGLKALAVLLVCLVIGAAWALLASRAGGSEPQARARAALELALALEQSAPAIPAAPATYAEALQQSLQRKVPLIVWVGEALCPGCVAATRDEFVHWVTPTFPDTPKDALVVGIPENSTVLRVGTVTEWPVGHIDTVREIVTRWRTTQQGTFPPTTQPYQPAQIQPQFQPQFQQFRPQQFAPQPQFFRQSSRRGGG